MTNKNNTPYNVNLLTNESVLLDLAHKIKEIRLRRNITQTTLAEESGIAKRTIERFEKGASIQLTSFIRILRTLGLLDELLNLTPEQTNSPMALMLAEKEGIYNAPKKRQRASKKRNLPPAESTWKWDD